MTNPTRKRVVTLDDLNVLNQNAAYARQKGEEASAAAQLADTARQNLEALGGDTQAAGQQATQAAQAATLAKNSATAAALQASQAAGDAVTAAELAEGAAGTANQAAGAATTAAQRITDAVLDLSGLKVDIEQTQQNLLGAIDGAARGAASAATGQINTVLAESQQLLLQQLAAAEVDGRVPTATALPAAANGTRFLVQDDLSVHEVIGGQWEPTGVSLAQRRAGLTSTMYTRALIEQTAVPATALPRLTSRLERAQPCVVVVMGDSISEGADQASLLDTYVSHLRDLFDHHWPGLVTVRKRALGGRRITDFVNPAFTAVPGFSEPADITAGYCHRYDDLDGTDWVVDGQSWQAAVQAAAPDAVIVAHGMNMALVNDPPAAHLPEFLAAIDLIRGWGADVILATTMLPASDFYRDVHTMRGMQESVRVAAAARDCAVVDVGRLSDILNTGSDATTLATTSRTLNMTNGTMSGWQGDLSAFNHAVPFAVLERLQAQGVITRDAQFQDGLLETGALFQTASELWQVAFRVQPDGSHVRLMMFPQQLNLFEFDAGGTPTLLGSWSHGNAFTGVWQYVSIEASRTRIRVRVQGADPNNPGRVVIDARSVRNLRPGIVWMGQREAGFSLPVQVRALNITFRSALGNTPLQTRREALGRALNDPNRTAADSGNNENHPEAENYHRSFVAAWGAFLTGLKGQLQPVASLPLALQNGWGAFGQYAVPTVTRAGRSVSLTGAAAGGTAGVLGVLPPELRPAARLRVPADSSGGPSAVEIAPDGTVESAAFGPGVWVSFAVTFAV